MALLVGFGPAYWGFGSRHLLLGADLPRDAIRAQAHVMPGDATVRRNSDLLDPRGRRRLHPRRTRRCSCASRTSRNGKRADAAADGQRAHFEFRLYAVRGPLQYYVDADGIRSAEHSVDGRGSAAHRAGAADVSYPEWTGLDPLTDEEIARHPRGRRHEREGRSRSPMRRWMRRRSSSTAQTGELDKRPRQHRRIVVTKPGTYQIGARVANEFVALSDEYKIEIVTDEKPTIQIRKPGRDWRATSIEEVPVHIQAEDDFRLRDVSLRYSVNGGEWQTAAGRRRRKQQRRRIAAATWSSSGAQATEPQTSGSARRSGLVLRRGEGSQAGGADRSVHGPGAAVRAHDSSRRRAEAAVAAAWATSRARFPSASAKFCSRPGICSATTSAKALAAAARRQRAMLAELQTTLRNRRARWRNALARALDVDADERIKNIRRKPGACCRLMEPAAGHLSAFSLHEAVPSEQQALQQLLRAESAFREVQVSMQQATAAAKARRPRAISPKCSSSKWMWRRASTRASRSCRNRTASRS